MAASIEPNLYLGRAVAAYTGGAVVSLEVAPDQTAGGVFAVQARVKLAPAISDETATTLQFLVRRPLHLTTEADLEEVEFASWPPTARI